MPDLLAERQPMPPPPSRRCSSGSALPLRSTVALLGVLLAVGCGSTPQPRTVPNTSTPTPVTSAPTMTPLAIGEQATIVSTPESPNGCSKNVTVSGQVKTVPGDGRTMWIVRVLDAAPPTDPNTLHYPKQMLPLVAGPYSVTVPISHQPGNRRTGSFLLVSADPSGNNDLILSKRADDLGDDTLYPDGDRVSLPNGVIVLARSATDRQVC